MREINAHELRKLRDRKDNFLLLNVLQPEEFREEHISGSENIPVNDPEFVKKATSTLGSKDKKVVVYCASTECDASEKATKMLEEAGFTNVYDFAGGMREWREADLPVEAEA